jgi:hypothetical protein
VCGLRTHAKFPLFIEDMDDWHIVSHFGPDFHFVQEAVRPDTLQGSGFWHRSVTWVIMGPVEGQESAHASDRIEGG